MINSYSQTKRQKLQLDIYTHTHTITEDNGYIRPFVSFQSKLEREENEDKEKKEENMNERTNDKEK